ncbi:hypothetical protein L6452_22338 [Arctium lappa]|uniref:Uncharacterized protein n=1 Tax=Arctium lappa TaxID=4217 RepID=A0ACB9B0A3_ARCLA|nr:hypothetical protein L6452_22338 [Arctium lappa]
MRGRSSSKRGRISRETGSMEKDKVKEEPHLSGAYIRSLVKHLTSTRTKDPFNGDGNNMQPESPLPQPQHKKQVRRRQHTTRPYQERLLNMAEARREIVTALKFHRASMKQQEAAANNHDLQSSQTYPQLEDQSLPPQPPSLVLGQESRTLNPTTNNYLDPPSLPYYWSISTIAPPPPLYHQNLNFKLPNQTLGLNLNFQDFKKMDTPQLYHNPLSVYLSSTSSSVATEEVVVANSLGGGGSDLHHAMDDEGMEEIRSLGEQHQMEWNDTVNLVMSARWFNFLKTMEIGGPTHKNDYDGFNPFDQVIEFPHWLMNTNEISSFQQHFSDDCLQDPALPCMEIGEIEGMDGEWKQD